MNIHANIAKELFEGKHAEKMNFTGYLTFLEEGIEILNQKKEDFSSCNNLNELKAIRIALQYRIEVLRQHRSKQAFAGGY